MTPSPIALTADRLDLSPRVYTTHTIVGSPALAAETIVASLTVTAELAVLEGVELVGWLAYTLGASGVSAQARIRQTGLAGTIIADTGALNAGDAAGKLGAHTLLGIDAAPVLPEQVYVLTLQVASGAAASTVSACYLRALVV